MDIFWLLRVLVIAIVVVWIVYKGATKETVGRKEGKTLVDKEPPS